MLRAAVRRAASSLSETTRHGIVQRRAHASAAATATATSNTTTPSTTSSSTTPSKAVSRATPAPPGNGPNHRSLMTLDAFSIRPYVQPNAYVAPSASVIGSVTINDCACIMYGAVVRGDLALLHIGIYTQIGENCVLTAGEVSDGLSPSDAVAAGLPIEPELLVGDLCDVGANCTLHSCFLDGENVVGHGSSIGTGSRLERFAELLPGSVVGEGVVIPEGEVWGGAPAVKVGVLTDDQKVKRTRKAYDSFRVTSAHAYEFLPGRGTAYWEKEGLEKGTALGA